VKRLIRIFIPTTMLVLSLAPAAFAGAVPVVTFAEVPADVEAGTPYTLDYSILAHGKEPMPFSETSLRFHSPDGETLSFPATSTGNGQWTAEVTLPEAGEWRWEVVAGTVVVQMLGTLPVNPAPVSASTALTTSLRFALPIATLLALVLLVNQVLPRARIKRPPSPATDVL
jgi:hypothetical protein